MHRRYQEGREEVPLPKNDSKEYKHVVTVGNKTYLFESQQEGRDFLFLIRIKHVTVEDALEHISKLRDDGYYGKKEGEDGSSGEF